MGHGRHPVIPPEKICAQLPLFLLRYPSPMHLARNFDYARLHLPKGFATAQPIAGDRVHGLFAQKNAAFFVLLTYRSFRKQHRSRPSPSQKTDQRSGGRFLYCFSHPTVGNSGLPRQKNGKWPQSGIPGVYDLRQVHSGSLFAVCSTHTLGMPISREPFGTRHQ